MKQKEKEQEEQSLKGKEYVELNEKLTSKLENFEIKQTKKN